MKKLLTAAMAVALLLTGCGSSGEKGNGDEGKTQETTKLSDKEIYTKLKEVSSWYTSELWNDGLCDISWYTKQGTSAIGQDLDIEMTLKRYNEALTKMEEYNSFISGLTDAKYDDVKYAWDKLYHGVKESDKIVQANEITAKSGLDLKTGVLSQYSDAFKDYIAKLQE